MQDSRTRHSSTTVAEARRMHASGWSCYQIVRVLRRRGISVDETTVASWCDPKLAERRRRVQRERMRRRNAARTGGRLGAGPPRSPEFRQARMESLAELGLPSSAIAKVMNFDFPGEPITETQVRYALETGRPPRTYRRIGAAA